MTEAKRSKMYRSATYAETVAAFVGDRATTQKSWRTSHTLFCDETGNSGSNYYYPDQPIYAEGGWLVAHDQRENLDAAILEIERRYGFTPKAAEANGCAISAGCWIRFLPNRVCLADKPEAGFDLDATQWHTYRIVRENGEIVIWVDDVEKLRSKIGDSWVREVRFGNRATAAGDEPYTKNRSVSHWRAVSAKVANPDDYSISWDWSPSKGYPDQFRRDRVVVLDYAAPGDCGYSSWTQMPDGTIVILDYTSGSLESFSWGNLGDGAAPFVRAYRVKESDLVRKQESDK